MPTIPWNAVDTVLLDMDGTLLDLNFDNHFWQVHVPLRYAESRGVALDAAREELMARYHARAGTLEWYSVDFWETELELDIMKLKEEVAHLIAVHPHVAAFLAAVRGAGKRVALATNAHHKSLTLKMARTGRFPGLLLVRADGSVREPAVWPHAEGRDLELARLEMQTGDAVVIYTDGLPRLMAERAAGTPAELLKKAAWFGQALTAESLRSALVESVMGPNSSAGAVLSDDLTAVVLRYDGKAVPLEGAA